MWTGTMILDRHDHAGTAPVSERSRSGKQSVGRQVLLKIDLRRRPSWCRTMTIVILKPILQADFRIRFSPALARRFITPDDDRLVMPKWFG